jgi:hypothetical protein
VIVATVVLIVALVAAMVLIGWVNHDSASDPLAKGLVLDRVLVTMADQSTWRGLLSAIDDRTLHMVDVEQLSPDGSSLDVAGAVYLPRADIAYVQRP